jgi:hypothetical protein
MSAGKAVNNKDKLEPKSDSWFDVWSYYEGECE